MLIKVREVNRYTRGYWVIFFLLVNDLPRVVDEVVLHCAFCRNLCSAVTASLTIIQSV